MAAAGLFMPRLGPAGDPRPDREQRPGALTSTNQTISPTAIQPNRLTLDSVLRSTGAGIAGDLFLDHLSQAVFGDGTVIGGALICDPSAEAFCFGSVQAAGSTCGGCPLP